MNNELQHFGVKGMKWGHRKIRGHAGPGVYATKKRQLAGDKRDLERLNNGQHLSAGVTKKRQAVYDARDKKALENRIAKNESVLKNKEQQKAARAEAKRKQAVKKVIARAAGQTVAGIAMTAAGRAMQNKGKSAVGEILSVGGLSLLGGTAVGAVAGGSLAIANNRRIKKQQAQYR